MLYERSVKLRSWLSGTTSCELASYPERATMPPPACTQFCSAVTSSDEKLQ